MERRGVPLAPRIRVRPGREQDSHGLRAVPRDRGVHGRVREPARQLQVHVGSVLEEDLDRLRVSEERGEPERGEALLLVRLVDPHAGLSQDRLEAPLVPDRRGLVEVQRILRRTVEQRLDRVRRVVIHRRQHERAVRGVHPKERGITVQDRGQLRRIVLLGGLEQVVFVPHRSASGAESVPGL